MKAVLDKNVQNNLVSKLKVMKELLLNKKKFTKLCKNGKKLNLRLHSYIKTVYLINFNKFKKILIIHGVLNIYKFLKQIVF